MYEIFYNSKVVSVDIPKLGKKERIIIRQAIERKLTVSPESYGVPLRQSLKGYRKLRVGDYRVIFYIEKKLIKILMIAHRSVVYEFVKKRI